ncbi:MAG: phosphatase PAP2 family protein [Clostridia bacterium]|nr:phosphatase PAP2 family protein [Clostridia bacterium]
MTAAQYTKWSRPFRENPTLKGALILYNTIATYALALGFLIALGALLWLRDERFLRVCLSPAAGLVIVSLVRILVNRKRPYETLDIEPLLKKKKSGQSFPSRHTFSAFAVSTAIFFLLPAVGIVCAVLSALLAVARVILGVHYPSDVIFGALFGVGLTALGLHLPLPL